MTRTPLSSLLLAAGAAFCASGAASAAQVEVLHYWTSGGEARSIAELKKTLAARGVNWKDFAVAGGAGENAATALKARVMSGGAPTAAQVKGPAIQEWGQEGVLASIDAVAKAGKWDTLLPPAVASISAGFAILRDSSIFATDSKCVAATHLGCGRRPCSRLPDRGSADVAVLARCDQMPRPETNSSPRELWRTLSSTLA